MGGSAGVLDELGVANCCVSVARAAMNVYPCFSVELSGLLLLALGMPAVFWPFHDGLENALFTLHDAMQVRVTMVALLMEDDPC